MDNSSHSDAFKRHALSLIEYAGMTLDEVAFKINVSSDTLQNWQETIDLFEGLETKEKETLFVSSTHERSTLIAPSTGGGSGTILQTWMGMAHSETIPSPELSEWTVPSYDHPTPLLSRGEELGKGGMGRVISGIQASTGREVAVKEVRKDKASNFIVRRLLQEAWITGLLEHPNIIPIYTIEKNEYNQLMILMKCVFG